jgi:TPR repeat protein
VINPIFQFATEERRKYLKTAMIEPFFGFVVADWELSNVYVALYVLLFLSYIYLAICSLKRKSWKCLAGSFLINTVVLLLTMPLGLMIGKIALAKQCPKEGEYLVSGTNPDNSTYSGKAKITKKAESYKIKWEIDASAKTPIQEYSSYGFVHDGNLCVYFKGPMNGIAVYSIMGNQLIGQWSGDAGLNQAEKTIISRGTETLTKTKKDPVSDEYLAIYVLIDSADKASAKSNDEEAKQKYQDAYDRLKKLASETDWEPTIIKYRLKYLQEKLGLVKKEDHLNTDPSKNYKYSEELFSKAQSGDAQSQYELAMCYRKGSGVPKDYQKSFEWTEKAAAQNHQEALFTKAVCYLQGEGVATDETAAVKIFSKLSEKDNAKAQFVLAICFLSGRGTTKNEKEAVKLFLKTAEKGDANAQYYLGRCLLNGIGVSQNKKEAIDWLKKSESLGDKSAKTLLQETLNSQSSTNPQQNR